jgi:hypothetical protein
MNHNQEFKIMDNSIDSSFDKQFELVNNLTWLPWVGKSYTNADRKLLIVGESHYAFADNDIDYEKKFREATQDKSLTRECIFESPICGDWRNNTFDNIHRVFLETNDFSKSIFWEYIAFYNFIPRLMDYRIKERPIWVDFYNSWKTFIDIIRIIKPTDCVFIGVSASNSFNQAMEEFRINYSPVVWLEGIGATYARISKIRIDGNELKLSFIQHASQMFSWSKWNLFLKRQNGEILNYLRKVVFNNQAIKIEELPIEQRIVTLTKNIPTYLSHKPVIACNYSEYTGDKNNDAKYLSIGHAQYDQDSASVKFFRYTGKKWSRQSEELPINRIGDMALMLLAAIKRIYKPSISSTILNEEEIKPEDINFLQSEIEINKERIKVSFGEIKRLLNEIDLEKELE